MFWRQVVSTSPLGPESQQAAAGAGALYLQNHARIGRLIDQGNSFSGHERNCMFMNTGGGRFATVSAVAGIDFDDDARSPGIVDWDHDGDLDIWVSNRTAPMLRFLRNDSSAGQRWLALRLEGKTCNRDAIGARVSVFPKGQAAPVVKTLKAGEGFLGQSSKWLHFGLGRAEQIEKLVVRWPGGDEVSFAGVASNQRYLLVEGGELELAPERPAPTAVGSGPAGLEFPAAGSGLQKLFGLRIPLPPLRLGGEDITATGRPVLVNLWATWCAPCAGELRSFASAAPAFEEAGLRVQLMTMDPLGDKAWDGDAAAALKSIGAPFPTVDADVEVVAQLRRAVTTALGVDRELPVPSSFLITGDGKLAACYLGPVAPQRVLQDLDALPLGATALQDKALPFPGRWFARPSSLDLMAVPRDLIFANRVADALTFVQRAGVTLEEHRDYGDLMVTIGDEVMRRGQPAEAIAIYGKGLSVRGDHLPTLNNLAWHLAAHPDRSVRDGGRAVQLAERAVDLTGGKDPAFLDTLAAAYAQNGEFERAVRTLELAEGIAGDDAALIEGIRSSLERYRSGRAQP